jgi:hypothetical protein
MAVEKQKPTRGSRSEAMTRAWERRREQFELNTQAAAGTNGASAKKKRKLTKRERSAIMKRAWERRRANGHAEPAAPSELDQAMRAASQIVELLNTLNVESRTAVLDYARAHHARH